MSLAHSSADQWHEEDEDEGVAGHEQQTVNQAGMIERPDPRAEVDSEEDA